MHKKLEISEALKKNLEAIDIFITSVSKTYSLDYQEVIGLLSQKEKLQSALIPTFILRDRKLGILESVTKYLKENLELPYRKIAGMLNRDDRVVWVTYNKALEKKKEKFVISEPNYWLPVSVFTDKELGPLESISKYLVENAKMEYSEIAKLLNRDSRSVWSCYRKSKLKTKKKK